MITLRRGRSEELEAVQTLLQACEMGVELDPGECLLAEEEGEVVGLGRLENSGGVPYLRPIAISPHHQHRGIGRQLLSALLTDLHELRVVARGKAFGFYSALGFESMDWDCVYAGYRQECAECPDHEQCGPVPMKYHWSPDETTSRANNAEQ
jgi:N-acetylglutamate synthase-like GNAT family acetyltransferase